MSRHFSSITTNGARDIVPLHCQMIVAMMKRGRSQDRWSRSEAVVTPKAFHGTLP
jgi:hypothetical protein